jgi:hypothetical protein
MAFDRQMLQLMDRDEAITDDACIDSRTADHTDYGGMGLGTDTPDMRSAMGTSPGPSTDSCISSAT